MTTTKGLAPEELETVLETLREFCDRNFPLEKRLQLDHEDRCPEEEVRKLMGPEVGMHLIFIPEEFGGMGGSPYDVFRLCEEFGKIDLGIATVLFAVSLGLEPFVTAGTEEQRKKWVTRVAEEGLLVAYGVTEPEAGSNVEALKTKAEPVTDADGKVTAYRISGVKQFISNGAIADLFSILAKTPEGPTFFAVEKGTPGLSAGKQEDKHGIRLSNTAQVILDNVEVPAENILGLQGGQGIAQSNKVFGYTRIMVAAFGLGAAESAVDKAVAFSKERKQFGTFLHEKQGYMNKLIVPHAVRIEASRAYIEEVVRTIMGGGTDIHVEGSVAKYFATEAGNAAAEAAIQALGGYGYCREYEVEKIKRDARILTIYEGTSEIQQNIIGLFRMRANVRAKGAFYRDLAEEMDGLKDKNVGAGVIAAAARLLGETTVMVFRNKLTRNQHALFVLADAVTEVETAAALCRKAAGADDEYLSTCSRLWAAEAAGQARRRIVRLMRGTSAISDEDFKKLLETFKLENVVEYDRGSLDDMDFVSRKLIGTTD